MLTYHTLRDLAAGNDDNAKEIYGIGEELIQAEHRIRRALAGIQRDIENTTAAVQEGRETGGLRNVNGSEVSGPLEALGERNALLRALRRLGVNPAKL